MKRFLSTFSMLVVMLILSTTSRAVSLTDFTYNSSGGYYEIRSANDMVKLSTFVQDDFNGAKGITFKVTVPELDFTGISFLPIGYMDQYILVNNAFQGTFDGQGVVIKNLTINRSDKDYIGLFGYVMNGSIQNVVLDSSCSITGKGYVGGIAGMIDEGSIQSCINKGIVKGSSSDVGGIAGSNWFNKNCLITQCENMGNVTGDALVGGIMGSNQKGGVITQCKNMGDVTGNSDVGGIVGQNMGDVNNNIVSGCKIRFIDSGSLLGSFAGAITAYSSGPLSKNYYTDDVEVVVGDNIYKDPTPRGYSGGSSLPYDVYTKEFEGVTYYNCAVPISYQGEDIPTTNELIYNENGYYEIRTADDMKTLCNRVNSGDRCQGLTFKVLVPELDMSGVTMSPIGETASAYFAGTLDGNGVVIKNLTITSTTEYTGLFGYSRGGTFQGITLDASCFITGSGTVGGIVATLNAGSIKDCHNYATIQVKDATDSRIYAGGIVGNIFSDAVLSDCSNHGYISGLTYIGGIAGINYVTLSGCTNYGTIEGTSYVGGIVGNNQSNGHIKDCINEGLVSCSESSVGGIVGFSNGHISDCITSTSSEVAGLSYVGGIAGSESNGKIEGCINNGKVSSSYGDAGGVISHISFGEVYNCTNNGEVQNTYPSSDSPSTIGGVIGGADSSIVTDCHNTGKVISMGSNVGGIAGSTQGSANSGSVNRCTNSGDIEGYAAIGGIVGYNSNNISECTNTGNVKGSYSEVGGIVGRSTGNASTIANNKVKSGTISGLAAVGAIGGGMINGTFSENYYYPVVKVIVQGKTYEETSPRGVGKIVIEGENAITVYPELYDITDNNGAVLNSNPDAEEDVTLTAKSYTRIYGEANPRFEYDVTEGTITYGAPNITCEATATSPVGTYDIIISKGTVNNNGMVNLVKGTLTITKAPLTISAGNYNKVEGEDNPEFTPVFNGFKNGETKDVLTKQPTITTTATKASKAGNYPVTISGAEAQNYEITYEPGTLTVTEPIVDVTLTAKSYTREYGEANPTFEYDVTDGTITSGTPEITCEATATSPVGTYDIVISKGTVSNNGTVNLVKGTLTITKAPLTISVGDYTKEEGEDSPEFIPVFTGFKNNETEDVLTKQPIVTSTATKDSPAGVYEVTVSGAEAQNYSISYQSGTLTVTEKPVELEAIEGESTMNTNALDGQDLSDNVVGNIYYVIGENGYDASDQSIVISQTTNMSQIADKQPGSADVKENFNGMILKVAKGKGLITVNVKTSGNAQLVVQVGNGTPMLASKTEKGDVVFRYDVEEDTYVYIYAIIGSSAAKGYGLNATDTDSSVRIYGITVSPGATGIRSIGSSEKNDDIIYDLQGRRVKNTAKGVYIVGGRKYSVK